MAVLDQRLDDLLGEERIPRGTRVDRRGQSAQARIVAEQVGEQLADRVRTERQQRELLVPRLLHPRGSVLGSEVDDQEPLATAADCVHHLLEPCLARAVDPVQVFDQRHQRALADVALRDLAQHPEQVPLARLGIHPRRRILRVRHAEEIEQQRQHLAVFLGEEQQAPRDLLAHQLIAVALADPVVLAEHL